MRKFLLLSLEVCMPLPHLWYFSFAKPSTNKTSFGIFCCLFHLPKVLRFSFGRTVFQEEDYFCLVINVPRWTKLQRQMKLEITWGCEFSNQNKPRASGRNVERHKLRVRIKQWCSADWRLKTSWSRWDLHQTTHSQHFVIFNLTIPIHSSVLTIWLCSTKFSCFFKTVPWENASIVAALRIPILLARLVGDFGWVSLRLILFWILDLVCGHNGETKSFRPTAKRTCRDRRRTKAKSPNIFQLWFLNMSWISVKNRSCWKRRPPMLERVSKVTWFYFIFQTCCLVDRFVFTLTFSASVVSVQSVQQQTKAVVGCNK